MTDLIRAIDCDMEVDFIQAASYSGTSSTGSVKMVKDMNIDPAGRHILLVEDIGNPHALSTGHLLSTPDLL